MVCTRHQHSSVARPCACCHAAQRLHECHRCPRRYRSISHVLDSLPARERAKSAPRRELPFPGQSARASFVCRTRQSLISRTHCLGTQCLVPSVRIDEFTLYTYTRYCAFVNDKHEEMLSSSNSPLSASLVISHLKCQFDSIAPISTDSRREGGGTVSDI